MSGTPRRSGAPERPGPVCQYGRGNGAQPPPDPPWLPQPGYRAPDWLPDQADSEPQPPVEFTVRSVPPTPVTYGSLAG